MGIKPPTIMGIDALMAMTFEPVVVPLESTPQTLGLYRVLSSDVVSGDYFSKIATITKEILISSSSGWWLNQPI